MDNIIKRLKKKELIICLIFFILGMASFRPVMKSGEADKDLKNSLKKSISQKIITKRIAKQPTTISSPTIPSPTTKITEPTIASRITVLIQPTIGVTEVPTVIIEPTKEPSIYSMTEYAGDQRFNLIQGKITFRVKADWYESEGDRVLLLGNYNGTDKKNLFEVIGLRNLLIFETYDSEGGSNSVDAPDADLGPDYYGKIFDITLTWDFSGEKKIKRIYVNRLLKLETEVEGEATDLNPKILVGKIENLAFSDKSDL